MSFITRLAFVVFTPIFLLVMIIGVRVDGFHSFTFSDRDILGCISMLLLTTTVFMNVPGFITRRFSSSMYLFGAILGVVVPSILLLPFENANWGILSIFAVCFLVIPFLGTIISGWRRVSHGYVVQVRGKLLSSGGRYYTLPFFMEEPKRIPTTYDFTINGNVVTTDGTPIVLSCIFSCVLDPREAKQEGVPLDQLAERAQAALRNIIDGTLSEHAAPTITVEDATHRILLHKKGFALPSLGPSARGVVKNFSVIYP